MFAQKLDKNGINTEALQIKAIVNLKIALSR